MTQTITINSTIGTVDELDENMSRVMWLAASQIMEEHLGIYCSLVTLGNGTRILYSCNLPVAAFVTGRGYLRTSQKCSRATSSHIRKWLDGATAAEVQQEELDALL